MHFLRDSTCVYAAFELDTINKTLKDASTMKAETCNWITQYKVR